MDQSEKGTLRGYEVEMSRSDGAWANRWCPVWETDPGLASSVEAGRSSRRLVEFACAERSDLTVTAGSG
ncbi:MAG: hypothetical protein A2Z37_09200 [Chloroflexi bacterium RBG_19FT_COMBO_62_14]|nr:MAG: hypothetical protein A2Z37_09200 [Chloroflexi bacterium RBG_19FT_COMBO_62_14]